MAGVEVPIVWRGRRAAAFVPARLSDRELALTPATTAAAGRAYAAVEHAAETMPNDYAALARLLLRSEGVASSFIEGVTAPVVEVVLAESHDTGVPAAAWVASNMAAARDAIDDAGRGLLSVADLLGWHRTLMAGSPTPARHVGVLRTEQGWIGGTSPLDAHLVTPPPDEVPDLVDDLISYANRDDIDPVVQAAVAHAQFELIHPFADGNGRVGRMLISWVLVRRMSLLTPPPVSVRLAADVAGYTSGLVLFRLGDADRWVAWFAEAVSGAGRAQRDLTEAVDALQIDWRTRLTQPPVGQQRLHANATAWRLLDLLPTYLVLTSPQVAEVLAVPAKTATAALGALVAAGILLEQGAAPIEGPGRPRTLYVSPELLGLAGATPLRS